MNPGLTNILLMTDTLRFGGTEGQFVEIACGLNRSRWNVHVSCLRAEGPLRPRLEAAGVRPWSCGRGSFKSLRFPLAVWEIARYLRAHRIQLVHSFDFYSNILGVPAARLARVPIVIASQRELGDLRPPLQRRVHRIVLQLSDFVLVNSGAVAERMKLHGGIAPARIVAIPNGVELARFSPPQTPTRHLSARVTIGTLANLRPGKGLGDLLHAAALVRDRFPDGRFVVWGEGPLRPGLEALVRTLDLGDVVELPGWTAEPEAALRELDIFVLPSHSEACSNALLEAMATGLPIVATRMGGNPAIVEDEVTGLLVPPGDPAALAKAIIRLVEDPMLAGRLGDRARDVVRSRFGLDRMLSCVQTLYERALAVRTPFMPEEPI